MEKTNDLSFIELVTRVAVRYYKDEMTQEEIARELGVSRQKVQRLLTQSRQMGIVEITIHTQPLDRSTLEKRLSEVFGLREVVITSTYSNEVHQREAVARAAAGYLARKLSKSDVVTIGMGRNTGEIPNHLYPGRSLGCTFVSAMGGSPYIGDGTNPYDICKKMAAQADGVAEVLYAPAYVESRRVRDLLLEQEVVARTHRLAQHANIAIVGIGTPEDDCTLVRMGCLSITEARRLCEAGAVGDLLGDFFDIHGQEIRSDLHGRLVGLNLIDLRKIPFVIGVVSEEDKTKAILGAIRTGVIHALITSELIALSLLEQAEITSANLP